MNRHIEVKTAHHLALVNKYFQSHLIRMTSEFGAKLKEKDEKIKALEKMAEDQRESFDMSNLTGVM